MLTDHRSALGGVASILGEYSPQCFHRPDRLALVWEHGALTYRDLRDRALRLAASLRALGLETSDRVATLLYNRGETFQLYHAIAMVLVFGGIWIAERSGRRMAAQQL